MSHFASVALPTVNAILALPGSSLPSSIFLQGAKKGRVINASTVGVMIDKELLQNSDLRAVRPSSGAARHQNSKFLVCSKSKRILACHMQVEALDRFRIVD